MNYRLTILFFFFTPLIFGQNLDIKRTYHWYFGRYAGIDFSSGNAVAVTGGQINSTEACSSISDKNTGLLLFYTDGITVWDKNHNVMQNGTGLMGCQSSTQGALIVPLPENDSLYYIFTTDCYENNYANGFRYSVVNMSSHAGLGSVTQKNILIRNSVAEKLTGTFNSVSKDMWVVIHGLSDSCFFSYRITNTGIDTNAVVSNIGLPEIYGFGQMKISPDGEKIALTFWNNSPPTPSLEVFSFNDSTGIVSNLLFSDASSYYYNIWGISFSTDNSKLYVTSGLLFQYDLNGSTVNDILSSRTLIIDSANSSFSPNGPLQLAPDGKIYLYVYRGNGWEDTLGVINNPNAIGYSCNINYNGLYLNGGKSSSLPNFLDSYFNGIFVSTNEILPNNHVLNVFPNPATNELTIDLTSPDKYFFNLFDILGARKLSARLDNNSKMVDLTSVDSGVYVFTIVDDQGDIIKTDKLIIIK